MGAVKQFWTDHFDEMSTYSSLKEDGYPEDEIKTMWGTMSKLSWKDFCDPTRTVKTLEEVLSEN